MLCEWRIFFRKLGKVNIQIGGIEIMEQFFKIKNDKLKEKIIKCTIEIEKHVNEFINGGKRSEDNKNS